ncbi:MAG: hypothetical protein WAM24_23155 [Ignavibacteriaceae bacterium]
MSVLIYSIAMGLLEAIVVVYLRDIFYPHGFKFPLMIIPDSTLQVEILREFCTLVMLVSIAVIAGKNRLQMLSYFLFSFAVWDLAYYIGLKLILNWPSSFFTWDILFLIPIPWIGPVLAPIISSVFMIILSLLFLFIQRRDENFKVKVVEWILIYSGAAVIFLSFIWNYAEIIISNNLLINIFSLKQSSFIEISQRYIPRYFHWDIFLLGIFSIVFSIFLILKRYGLILKRNEASL